MKYFADIHCHPTLKAYGHSFPGRENSKNLKSKSSVSQADKSGGKIPYPTKGDKIAGGHAIVVAGYDDAMKIKNTGVGGTETTGAFLIRNSWGTDWGENGYGWLPYDYVLKGLAEDWWSLLKNEWVDTGNFMS